MGEVGLNTKLVESGFVVKNSVIGIAEASLEARLARPQLVSIVFVNE
jgi:hypothetical protein